LKSKDIKNINKINNSPSKSITSEDDILVYSTPKKIEIRNKLSLSEDVYQVKRNFTLLFKQMKE
jgi:hypothetical protein